MSKEKAPEAKVKCGIIMPLSEIDGCSAGHWQEVLHIIKESLSDTQFEPEIVSNADESGVIQKRIVTNLYENPIAVCDVSAKNPNVMFELGMRLAFDKPTVVIKDDKTDYSFDTSPIEHIPYPRDLHYQQIVEFKTRLNAKVVATFKESQSNKDYSCFLKHFIQYQAKSLPTQEIPATELILKRLDEITTHIATTRQIPFVFSSPNEAFANREERYYGPQSPTVRYKLRGSKEALWEFNVDLSRLTRKFRISNDNYEGTVLNVTFDSRFNAADLEKLLEKHGIGVSVFRLPTNEEEAL